jgi:hypothetical protein
MLTPVLIRRLTLCFSIVSITQGSSVLMVVTGAWMGGPRTCHWVGGSGLSSPGNRGQFVLQWFPPQREQDPGGDFLRGGDSLPKCPVCPHWKHVLGVGLYPGGTSLSSAVRASCHLSFLFSLSRSFFFFFFLSP